MEGRHGLDNDRDAVLDRPGQFAHARCGADAGDGHSAAEQDLGQQ
jgi:hypothetical protein